VKSPIEPKPYAGAPKQRLSYVPTYRLSPAPTQEFGSRVTVVSLSDHYGPAWIESKSERGASRI
jgi:hypothetical protein